MPNINREDQTMAKQPNALKHGATARFENNPAKRKHFEQLCLELQAEYRVKTRSEFEVVKALATEFMRIEHNAIAEQAKLEELDLKSQFTSKPLDDLDGNLEMKMRYARNFEAGVYNFQSDEDEIALINTIAKTELMTRELATLINNKQDGSLRTIIEETDRLGLQLKAILADSKVRPDLFTTYLQDHPHLLSEIIQNRWFDRKVRSLALTDLPEQHDGRLAKLMNQLFLDCLSEQLAFVMHKQLCQYNQLRPRLVTLPDDEAERYRRYATSSTNAITKLIKTLREAVNERERYEAYIVSSA